MLTISPVTGSRWTAAVRPTPEDPLPVVYTALGEMWAMCLISWLLATPGSPAEPTRRPVALQAFHAIFALPTTTHALFSDQFTKSCHTCRTCQVRFL